MSEEEEKWFLPLLPPCITLADPEKNVTPSLGRRHTVSGAIRGSLCRTETLQNVFPTHEDIKKKNSADADMLALNIKIDNLRKETKKWMEVTEKWRVLSEMWKDEAKKSRATFDKWRTELDAWRASIDEWRFSENFERGDSVAAPSRQIEVQQPVILAQQTIVQAQPSTLGFYNMIFVTIRMPYNLCVAFWRRWWRQ